MAKRLQEYVKYTKAELESYVATTGSCVFKINSNLHFSLNPYVLADLKSALVGYISKNKIGYYVPSLDGVVLGIRNIKVLKGTAALRADDPHLHVDINADCYVFKPEEGGELTGIVKHIGKQHVSVIIYRVYNANIRLKQELDKSQVHLDQELRFRIRKYNLQTMHPYIEGELLKSENQPKAKKITFDSENHESATPDSGIEERDESTELTELLAAIKNEPLTDYEETLGTTSNSIEHNSESKSTKRKITQYSDDDSSTDSEKVSAEPPKKKERTLSKTRNSVERTESPAEIVIKNEPITDVESTFGSPRKGNDSLFVEPRKKKTKPEKTKKKSIESTKGISVPEVKIKSEPLTDNEMSTKKKSKKQNQKSVDSPSTTPTPKSTDAKKSTKKSSQKANEDEVLSVKTEITKKVKKEKFD